MSDNNIFVTSPPRIAPILANEMRELGFTNLTEENKGVHLKGTFLDTMKMNLYLRTANRVLFKIKSFQASNAEDLYKHTKDIPWENYIDVNSYFSVQSSVRNENIKDNRYANLNLKDAIVDRMVEKTGKRPDSGPDYSRVVIFLFWNENDATIYYDTSGETISRRSYRMNPWKAPMNEALAAATILASKWDQKMPFVNPMCGSGTLAIEAALISMNRAPGIDRENYSFMHSKMHDTRIWRMLRNEAISKAKRKPLAVIVASDNNPGAIAAAKENAKNAGVSKFIEFQTCDYKETTFPKEKGVVFLNPEYGARLGEAEPLMEVYKEIGDFFKNKCQNFIGYIFTGNMELAKSVGLATSKKTPLFNAKIDCRLLEYELYSGSKRNIDELITD